jgi:hypothetical protein
MAQPDTMAKREDAMEKQEHPEPELDFEGDVKVTNDLPSKDMLARCTDLVVLDSKGQSHTFESLYHGEAAASRQLIIFVRHFFCGVSLWFEWLQYCNVVAWMLTDVHKNCQEYLRTLSSSITPDSLLSLPTPTSITVIGCGQPDLIDMYVQTTNCPFAVYADPTRKLYEHLGMIRTLNLGKKKPDYMQSSIIGGAVHSIYQIIKSGGSPWKGGDMKQIGGEFLFENGKPVWCHRMRNTRDHAEIPELRMVLGLDDARPPMRKRWSSIKELGKRSRSNSWGRSRSRSNARDKVEKRESTEMERVGLLDDKPQQISVATA